jgi:vacuolar-type H+-ATPase subunit F/Vma7
MNRLVLFILTISILFCFQLNVFAQADAISKYFNKYVEDDRFTVVYISPKMISMFKNMDLHLEDKEAQAVMNITKDMKGLRILIAEENTMDLYEEALKTINTKEYEVLMTIRDKKEDNVQFLVKTSTDENFVEELLLLVGGTDSFVLMSIVGKIDLKKVSQLSEAFDDDDDDKN